MLTTRLLPSGREVYEISRRDAKPGRKPRRRGGTEEDTEKKRQSSDLTAEDAEIAETKKLVFLSVRILSALRALCDLCG
jgi:hypothetical protein